MEKRREINKSRRRKRSKGVNRLEIEVFDNWPIIKNFNRPERGYSDRFLGKKEIISAKMLILPLDQRRRKKSFVSYSLGLQRN